MNGTRKKPEIYVCALPNKQKYQIVQSSGFYNGARLIRDLGSISIRFADQNWKDPNLVVYKKLVAAYNPYAATVIDYESHISFDTVMEWCNAISPHVSRIIVIPKVKCSVQNIPLTCNGVDIVLGYSVPTKYSGTDVDISEFYGRKVHFLGGSPKKQINLFLNHYKHMDIVSLDNNYILMKANKFVEYWDYSSINPLTSSWYLLSGSKESVRERTNIAFTRSLCNFHAYWEELGKSLW